MNAAPYIRKAFFYETDQMGIIHHSNYIRWFEEARVHYMDEIGYPYAKISSQGIDFAVLGVTCQYKSMVHFHETVEIHASIGAITPTRLTMQYEVLHAETKKVCTTGESAHCFFDRVTQKPIVLKHRVPELFQLLLVQSEQTTAGF